LWRSATTATHCRQARAPGNRRNLQ
jgi:hypothetical protein